MSNQGIYLFTTWAIPVIIAITFHEAAHGFAAHRLGDDTAWRLGRVTLNPIRHIDPFGTILLPGMLLLTGSPILFGYAKPVPVKFSALQHPRRDMILVAAAGPAINVVLAIAAGLAFHIVPLPARHRRAMARGEFAQRLAAERDAGGVQFVSAAAVGRRSHLVGLLPRPAAIAVSRIEPYGLFILIGLLILLPLLSTQFGVDVDVIGRWLSIGSRAIIKAIIVITGNG